MDVHRGKDFHPVSIQGKNLFTPCPVEPPRQALANIASSDNLTCLTRANLNVWLRGYSWISNIKHGADVAILWQIPKSSGHSEWQVMALVWSFSLREPQNRCVVYASTGIVVTSKSVKMQNLVPFFSAELCSAWAGHGHIPGHFTAILFPVMHDW